MRLWIVTNLSIEPGKGMAASAIQNLQTAAALARAGHDVLLWTDELAGGWKNHLKEFLGLEIPPRLKFLACSPRGEEGAKRTPFSTPLERAKNFFRARRLGAWPEAVLCRSPLALAQLRASMLFPSRVKLVLEYQYPEYALLWRGWRKKHPEAAARACVRELARLKGAEANSLRRGPDGVLYAAHGHLPLMRRFGAGLAAAWIPSGCVAPEAAPADENSAERELGYVGTLAPENGIECLIRAVARVPGARLILIGDGSKGYREKLEAEAKASGVADRVEFAGGAPFKEIRAKMRRCRVGVVPISARAGPEKRQFASPLKLVEWMAAGVPVVASRVPSVAQHAEAGGAARLVAPDSPAVLAGALSEILASPGRRAELAERGLALARESTFDARALRIVHFIDGLERK